MLDRFRRRMRRQPDQAPGTRGTLARNLLLTEPADISYSRGGCPHVCLRAGPAHSDTASNC